MAKFTGTCIARMNGVSLRIGEGSIDIGGWNRTAVMVDHAVQGYTEEPTPSVVQVTGKHLAETELTLLRDATDVTVTFETDTGAVYQVGGAWTTKPPVLSSGEGEIEIEFNGPPAEQVK